MKNSDRKIIYTGFRNGYTGEPIQFEIVGLDRYVDGNKYPNKRMFINGTEIYARILIKRV